MTSAQKALELDMLAERVILPYIIMAVVLVLLAGMIYLSGLPEVDMEKEDENKVEGISEKTSIFHFPHLMLGVFALFVYVGAEVIAGDSIISYGASLGIEFETAKFFTTCTLVAMLIGYVLGIITIPKYLSQEAALKGSAILGIVFTLGAILTNGFTSVLFIALLGLANSLVWPAIWPLALADVGRFTKIASSLLVMAIAGGAILPLGYGYLADNLSPQQAYLLLIPCYLIILYYSVSGHKIRRWNFAWESSQLRNTTD
jgi:glucose/galactose transporter